MKAVLEVKTSTQTWAPPFTKRSESTELSVEAGESFDKIDDERGFVFTIVKVEPDRVLVEYNRAYTPKGYSQPANRRMWIEKNNFTEFSFLWGNHGTTKALKMKGIESESTAVQPAQSESLTAL
jgi:hypothetical protein